MKTWANDTEHDLKNPEKMKSCFQRFFKSIEIHENPQQSNKNFKYINKRKEILHIRPNYKLVNKIIRINVRQFGNPRLLDNKLIYLELPENTYPRIPCWSGGPRYWAKVTVAMAYDTDYAKIRPRMCNGGISRSTLITIAEAMANAADWSTGRNSRPTNKQLKIKTGFNKRTIQRAHECLRLLGIATEALRGRKFSSTEKQLLKQSSKKNKGWASVWALHDSPKINRLVYNLSSHLGNKYLKYINSSLNKLTTKLKIRIKTYKTRKTKKTNKNLKGLKLSKEWRANLGAPSWARRYSVNAWSTILEKPANHEWNPRDINLLINRWMQVKNYTIPNCPYKPIGLLGKILAWHGVENLSNRPTIEEEKRITKEKEEALIRIKNQKKQQEQQKNVKPVGSTVRGPGRMEALRVAALIHRRAIKKRTFEAERVNRRLQEAVKRARTNTN